MEKQKHSTFTVVMMIVLLAAVITLGGCRSSQKAVAQVSKEKVVQIDTLLQRDSIYVRDSVWMTIQGDTVWAYKWHTMYKDRIVYRTSLDTLLRTDTITVMKEVVKEKSIGTAKRIGMWVIDGIVWILLIVVIYLVVKYGKWFSKL